MSKHVLAILVSPRKGGSSDTLCDGFIRGVRESGNQAEKTFLTSRKIGYCIGCGACSATRKCVQKDEMVEILDRMVDADVVILATPVCFYAMDAQVKILTDCTVPGCTEIQDKDFYFIMAAADIEQKMMDHIIEGLRGLTQGCLTGVREKGIIYGTGAWQARETKGTSAVEQAYEIGRNIQSKYKMHDGPEDISCIFFEQLRLQGTNARGD